MNGRTVDADPAGVKGAVSPVRERIRISTTFEDLAAHLEYVSGRYALSNDELAGLFSTSPRSVENWRRRISRPSAPVTVTILEVLRILDLLDGAIGPEAVRSWLYSANPPLDCDQPAELIASGELPAVEAEIRSWMFASTPNSGESQG